ncbi:MAG: tyrosine-type recombinase/integrase [Steroidobacteraceae bacterium]|jgi:integrase
MEIAPCRRGHTEPRNSFGQCVVCLRESRRAYKKSHATKPRTRIAPPVVTTPTTRDTPPIPRSFLAVAREYLSSQDDAAPATVKKRNFILEQLHALHDAPIAELTTPRIVAALKVIEAEKDRRETAHRCAMLAGQVTRYALNHGYVTHNVLPAGQLRGTLRPVKVDSHAAIVEPKRFGTLLKYIDLYCEFAGSRSQPGVRWAMRLAPLVFVRPGELRKMEWAEVNFDKAEWVIPVEKMKMRRPHVVPLAKQALAILKSAHKVTGKDRFVFRTRRLDEPLSENGFREALHTILGAMGEPKDVHTMHGFRSSASTLLNGELGIDSALIELQLAHVKGDRVQGIYDRSQRLPERRQMMQRWAAYLDKLKKGE